MSYEKLLKEHLKNSTIIDEVDKYSLYYNHKKSVLGIYDGKDLYEADLKKLGEALFDSK